METEKVCVNLAGAELGTIDLLVAKGLYTSRSDVIRAGLRHVVGDHEAMVEKVTEKATTVGIMAVGRRDLEDLKAKRKRLNLFVVGILRIAPDVTPALADATIEHIQLLGSLRAPAEVEARIADRVDRGLSMDYA